MESITPNPPKSGNNDVVRVVGPKGRLSARKISKVSTDLTPSSASKLDEIPGEKPRPGEHRSSLRARRSAVTDGTQSRRQSYSEKTAAQCELELNEAIYKVFGSVLGSNLNSSEKSADDEGTSTWKATASTLLSEAGTVKRENFVRFCFEILEDIKKLHGIPESLSKFLKICIDIFRRAAFQTVTNSTATNTGDEEPIVSELYRSRIETLDHEIHEANEAKRKFRTLSSLKKKEYLSLVKEYEEIENTIEKILLEEKEINDENQRLKVEVKLMRPEMKTVQEEHVELSNQILLTSQKIKEKSQIQYEIGKRKNGLQYDIQNIRKKIETQRAIIESSDGMVSQNVVKQVEENVASIRESLKSKERTFQVKQAAYIEIVKQVRDEDDKLQQARKKKEEILSKRQEYLRALTPRPDWSRRDREHLLENFEIDGYNEAIGEYNHDESKVPTTINRVYQLCELFEKHKLDGKEVFDVLQEKRSLYEKLNQLHAEIQAGEAMLPANSPLLVSTKETKLAFNFKFSKVTKPNGEVIQVIKGLGNGSDIPQYLRYGGDVELRPMKRTEMLTLVNDVWALRYDKEEESNDQNTPLSEYFFQFLKKQYGVQSVIVKQSYNLMNSIGKVSNDVGLELFLLTLQGDIPENTHRDQQDMLISLEKIIMRIHQLEGSVPSGEISKSSFFSALPILFPGMIKLQLDALETASPFDQSEALVPIDMLLLEVQDEFAPKILTTLLKEYHFREIKSFWFGLSQQLHFSPTATTKKGICTIGDIITAFRKMKFKFDADQVTKLICTGLELEYDDILPLTDPLRYYAKDFIHEEAEDQPKLATEVSIPSFLGKLRLHNFKVPGIYSANAYQLLRITVDGDIFAAEKQEEESRWSVARNTIRAIS